MNILIAGLPKSGTSVIHLSVCAMFPKLVRNSERIQFLTDEDFAKGTVCKELIDKPNKFDLRGSFYDRFDKFIIISRDPRDRIVSAILYAGFNILFNKPELKEAFLNKIIEKERDPLSVTCMELIEILRVASGIKQHKGHEFEIPTLGADIYLLKFLEEIKKKSKPCEIVRYEDYINEKNSGLELFLGVDKLKTNVISHRTLRSKRPKEWVNWFTPEDVEIFRPVVSDIIEHFGYDGWDLAEKPFIDPKLSSEWATAKIEERYQMHLRGLAEQEKKRKAEEEKKKNENL